MNEITLHFDIDDENMLRGITVLSNTTTLPNNMDMVMAIAIAIVRLPNQTDDDVAVRGLLNELNIETEE